MLLRWHYIVNGFEIDYWKMHIILLFLNCIRRSADEEPEISFLQNICVHFILISFIICPCYTMCSTHTA